VAITGATLVNRTLDELPSLCRPGAVVLVLGPSTPVSTVLFDHGVELVSGCVVEDLEPVLETVCQGGGFRQIRRRGVRLVTMQKGG
jgi:uncharacterized protein (DUF4213/DUF364 family)